MPINEAIAAHWMKVVGGIALSLAVLVIAAIAGVVWIDHEMVGKHETHIQGSIENSKDRYTGQQARDERMRQDAMDLDQYDRLYKLHGEVQYLLGQSECE